jgi:hypothetical protein
VDLAGSVPDVPRLHGDAGGGLDRPFFMGHGLLDTDAPYAAAVATLIANHQPVSFRTCLADHSGTLIESQKDTDPFVRALFAGP